MCAQSCLTLGPPKNGQKTVAHRAPLSRGFSRQEYWNGLPFSPPGHLPYPGIKLIISCIPFIGRQILYHWAIWAVQYYCVYIRYIICTEYVYIIPILNISYVNIYAYKIIYIYVYMVRDREAWRAAVHEVAKSQTWLGDWTTIYIYVPERVVWGYLAHDVTWSRHLFFRPLVNLKATALGPPFYCYLGPPLKDSHATLCFLCHTLVIV